MSDHSPARTAGAIPSEDAQARALMQKALTIGRIYYQGNLRTPEAAAYTEQRCLSKSSISRFELGYAPDVWRGLVDHFSSHKVRLSAVEAGLLTTPENSNRLLDFFRGRLMFPIRNHQGELAGYAGRLIEDKPGTPKYMNTPETPLFQKAKILYGLHQHLCEITKRREAIIVEGYLDVIALSSHGFPFACAPMGTALTPDQITLLLAQGVRKIIMCFDGDDAGQKAAERNIEVIMQHYHPGLEVMIITLPDGHDPDSLLRESGPEAFRLQMEASVNLPDYIHKICTKGFADKPCLEDKALYLIRLEPFLDRACGFLQTRLRDRAITFTGLKSSQIYEGKQARTDIESISKWHPLVALAARWMAFDDELTVKIAQQFRRFDTEKYGLKDLAAFAVDIQAGTETTSPMRSFVMAHGPLIEQEFEELHSKWGAWVKGAQIESNLTALLQMPFDTSSKNSIKQLLR